MALVVYDRVQETTATTGTGTITLSGAVTGYQSFAVVGDGNTTFYCIINGANWEVGIGTYSTTGPTLARTTVLSNSSGTTSPITLVGASNVFCTYPSEKSVNLNADGVLEIGSPIGYVDTGIIATFASTEAGYNQIIVQNKSNATNASANINISNDVSTDTTGFAELGINSSQFTGTGSFSIAGAAYLASAGTDLTIGTYNANDIHIVTNSNTVDAMTIHDDGGIALGGLADPGIGNIACNNINLKFQQVVTSGGTTTLTNASPYFTQFTGTSTQDLILPDATTCLVGTTFIFDNDSTQNVTIKDGAGTTFELLVPGGYHNFVLEQNATVAGTWLRYSSVPSTVEWGTNSLQLSTTVISGGTWQGGTIQSGYGGTGLTTFVAANNALYSTGASTLTAGTLPAAAGGTGNTTGQAASVANALSAGTGLNYTGGGTYDGSAAKTVNIADTAVTPGSYTLASITVDQQGRITAASSGSNPPPFAAGTALLFYQSAAPTGWTKDTTNNDKALRVVSGTSGGSAGGSVAFSTAFASQTPSGTVSVSVSSGTLAGTIGTLAATAGTLAVGAGTFAVAATTLSTSQIPSHTHTVTYGNTASTYGVYYSSIKSDGSSLQNTGATGGGGSHTHTLSGAPSISGTPGLTGTPGISGSPSVTSATFSGSAINLAVQYCDVIICTKD